MVFGDLPPHTVFDFGEYMSWEKLDEHGRCISLRATSFTPFDNRRRGSGRTDFERRYGTNYLPETHLFSYLNSNDQYWHGRYDYSEVARDYDAPYEGRPGFVRRLFSGPDSEALTPWKMKVHSLPRHGAGRVDEVECLLGFPCAEDIQASRLFHACPNDIALNTIHTNCCGRWNGEKSIPLLPNQPVYIYPVIYIRPDVDVRQVLSDLYIVDSGKFLNRRIKASLTSLLTSAATV